MLAKSWHELGKSSGNDAKHCLQGLVNVVVCILPSGERGRDEESLGEDTEGVVDIADLSRNEVS